MTHTKGPWKVNKFSGRGPLDDEYAVTYTHPNGYVQTIARVVLGHPESMDGVAANTTLIAAAPDMYIALQNVRVELDSYPHCPFCGSVHGEGHEKDCIGYEIETAIRKAEGEK